MTKYERKLQYMLNYYQVEVNGEKDEKMSKKELQRYLYAIMGVNINT